VMAQVFAVFPVLSLAEGERRHAGLHHSLEKLLTFPLGTSAGRLVAGKEKSPETGAL
jgi:hypothetical protein